MGEAADALAGMLGISRERQDEYAARSHALTFAAQQAGRYDPEIVAVQELSRGRAAAGRV